jgi:small subunit ribosomal protein S16
MLTIRFNRTGKRNRAQFRIVLQEHTVAPGGRHVEVLGSYDPHMKKAVINGEKVKEWIGKGAQISDSVYNLLVKEGIVDGKKRTIKIPKAEVAASEEATAEASEKKETKAEEKPAKEVKPEEPAAPKDEKPAEK